MAYIFVLLAAPFIIVWFVLIGWPARLARRTPLWFGLPFGLLWFGVPAFAIVRDLLT
ncbi:hypothetical protein D3C74_477670 [compost metagenome]